MPVLPAPSRLAGAALVAGALLLVVAYVLRDVAGDAVSGAVVTAGGATNVAGILLMLLGMPAWYAAQAHRARVAGLIAFVVSFCGLAALELGTAPYYAFGLPGLVEDFPGLAEVSYETVTPAMGVFFVLGLAGANLGMVALGVVTAIAGVMPRAAGIMVAAGPLLVFAPVDVPFGEAIALSVAWAGVAWIGAHLASGQAGRRAVPAPAAVAA